MASPSTSHQVQILQAFTRLFGAPPDELWFDEEPGPLNSWEGDDPIGCALFTGESTDRPCNTLVTIGMSSAAMVMDDRAVDTDTPRVELVSYIEDEDLPADDLVHWMRWLGRFPFAEDPPTFLGWGHTIPIGQPIFPDSPLTTLFTVPTLVIPDQGTVMEVDGDPVTLLWLTFLTDAEYALKKKSGENAILDLFEKCEHPISFERTRSSYV